MQQHFYAYSMLSTQAHTHTHRHRHTDTLTPTNWWHAWLKSNQSTHVHMLLLQSNQSTHVHMHTHLVVLLVEHHPGLGIRD